MIEKLETDGKRNRNKQLDLLSWHFVIHGLQTKNLTDVGDPFTFHVTGNFFNLSDAWVCEL